MRRTNANYLNKKLSKINEITLPVPPSNMFHVYQMYTIRVKTGKEKRDALMKHLEKNGIMTKIYFSPPIHRTQFYTNKFGYKQGDFPATEKISGEVLTLPMYANMKDEDKEYIIEKVVEFFA